MLTSSALKDLVAAVLSPSPLVFTTALVVTLFIPLFLHFFVYRSSGYASLPSILLLGPSGSGKTALTTLFERGKHAETHTSQAPLAVECSLPLGTKAGSDRYRSDHDPSNKAHKKFYLLDTPGHGKLRHHALGSITHAQSLKGLIFMVDANTLSAGDDNLRQTAHYLHDVLLLLQKRASNRKMSKVPKDLPVLVAANKMDLFTALPVPLVKASLEREIAKVRSSRSKSLLDSGIGMEENQEADSDDWLGELGSKEFKFTQLEDFNISVEVAGGNVLGEDGSSVSAWWKWVGQRL